MSIITEKFQTSKSRSHEIEEALREMNLVLKEMSKYGEYFDAVDSYLIELEFAKTKNILSNIITQNEENDPLLLSQIRIEVSGLVKENDPSLLVMRKHVIYTMFDIWKKAKIHGNIFNAFINSDPFTPDSIWKEECSEYRYIVSVLKTGIYKEYFKDIPERSAL